VMHLPDFLAPITAAMVADPRCRGLYLAGSHATGTEDDWSDLDLVGVAEQADHAGIAGNWRGILAGIAPLVLYRSQPTPEVILINAITADWDRIDLLLEGPARFARRAQGRVRPLHDPDQRHAALSADVPDPPVSAAAVVWLTEEFLRVLGLSHVALGRGDHVVGATGAGLLRDHLITLMRREAGVQNEGALHLARSLPAADLAVLQALPLPAPDRASVIAANIALARAFLPRARAVHARLGLTWPDAFEEATRQRLIRSFGDEADIVW
jgi:hypothetical protein